MLGLKEVEPVEEQDLTEVDMDPHMAIWKAMKQFHQQKDNKPEHLAGNEQDEAYLEPQFYRRGLLYQEAEKDLDDIYHNIRGLVIHDDFKDRVLHPEIPSIESIVYLTPEEDLDGLYHGDFTSQVFQVPVIFPEDHHKNVHTEPEEDKDHLSHS